MAVPVARAGSLATARKWRKDRIKYSTDSMHRSCGGCMTPIFILVTLCTLGNGTNAHEVVESKLQQTPNRVYVAGSHLLALASHFGDVDRALVQRGPVDKCSDDVNARVEREFLADDRRRLCKREAANADVSELFRPSTELIAPSEPQIMSLCSAEACETWLRRAIDATWLPDCTYRQSQLSLRSLAETLVQIREDFIAFGESYDVVAPNASLFREFYTITLLSHLQRTKNTEMNFTLPSRKASLQADFKSRETRHSVRRNTAVDGATDSTSRDSNADDLLSSDFNVFDTTGFANHDVGPQASSTTTTTELTPSYAYVVGAWVLFNSTYFFFMRKKYEISHTSH